MNRIRSGNAIGGTMIKICKTEENSILCRKIYTYYAKKVQNRLLPEVPSEKAFTSSVDLHIQYLQLARQVYRLSACFMLPCRYVAENMTAGHV